MSISTQRLLTSLPATGILLGVLGLSAGYAMTAAEVAGTNQADTFSPTANPNAANSYLTSDDEDRIRALGGADNINTAGGDDAIDAGPGDDIVHGGEGDDVIAGGEGNDALDGDAGDDLIHGQDGNDIIDGGLGDDTLHGEEGEDHIRGQQGDDTITGGGWDDQLEGGPGDDTLDGGGGNDEIKGDDQDDLLHGGDGNDLLQGGRHNDHLYGDKGDDNLQGHDGFDYLDGGEGEDLLDGENGSDVIIGRDSNDTLAGGGGDDYIAIVGSDLSDYRIFDKREVHPQTQVVTDVDAGTDMLCFVRDINPDQMTILTHRGHEYLQFDPGLATHDDIDLVLGDYEMLKFIEVIRTGEGDDTIIGRDITGRDSYGARFLPEEGIRFIQCDELFFLGGGDDTITTAGGNDLVSAGAGDDTISLGNGEHYVMTGDGRDTVTFDGTEFNGSTGGVDRIGRCRIADISNDDKIIITGGLDVRAFSLETHDWNGTPVVKVIYGDSDTNLQNEQFDIVGVRANQVSLRQNGQNIEITARVTRPVVPAVDPTQPAEAGHDRLPEDERDPRGGGRDLPSPRGDRNDRGGR